MTDQDNKIVALRGGKFASSAPEEEKPFEPNPAILELIEDFTERFKRGELRSIAFAAVTENGGVSTAFGTTGNDVPLLSAVALLQYRVQRYFYDSMD